jgi:hypothetical protein
VSASGDPGKALEYVTLVVRLLVDRSGRLDHGEVVDTQGTVRGRFKDWSGLLSAVRRLVERADAGGDS